MCKLISVTAAFLVLLALTQARPSYLHTSVVPSYEHIEYAPSVVGHELHSIPTAVSHQSQTIVHEKRPYLRPIVEHTPYVKSYAPIVKSYVPSSAVEYSVPYSPLAYSGLYDHGWAPSYPSSVYGDWNAWPLK